LPLSAVLSDWLFKKEQALNETVPSKSENTSKSEVITFLISFSPLGELALF
jgi:hypothetical protein